jgi:hypothetical protein
MSLQFNGPMTMVQVDVESGRNRACELHAPVTASQPCQESLVSQPDFHPLTYSTPFTFNSLHLEAKYSIYSRVFGSNRSDPRSSNLVAAAVSINSSFIRIHNLYKSFAFQVKPKIWVQILQDQTHPTQASPFNQQSGKRSIIQQTRIGGPAKSEPRKQITQYGLKMRPKWRNIAFEFTLV